MKKDYFQFEEGHFYPFLVKGFTSLTISDIPFLVLEDQSGTRHLISSEYYSQYGFKTGAHIQCKIDHISCSGKIYIEPPHPNYKEGKFYNFTVIEKGVVSNTLNFEQPALWVEDEKGNHFAIPAGTNPIPFSPGENIQCQVLFIKKGKIFLLNAELNPIDHLFPGTVHLFKIQSEIPLEDKKPFWILSDPKGNYHFIETEPYLKFQFSIGQEIPCRITKFSSGGYFVLEPIHPAYKIDGKYRFELLKTGFVFDNDGSKLELAHSKDVFDNWVAFAVPDIEFEVDRKHFWYTVKRIRKGKIYTGY